MSTSNPPKDVISVAPKVGIRGVTHQFIWQDLLHASVDIRVERAKVLLAQIVSGEVLAIAVVLAYSIIYEPVVGGLAYLMWACLMIAVFEIRRIWCKRLLPLTADNADRILQVISVTTWSLVFAIALPVILWLGRLSPYEQIFVLALQTVWVVMGISIIGIAPRTYQIYMVLSLACLLLGAWIWLSNNDHLIIITAGYVLGGFVLWRIASSLGTALSNTVSARAQNMALVHKLEATLAQASELQAARSRFLAAASHDLLQPIQTMLLLAPMVKITTEPARLSELGDQLGATVVSIDGMFRGFLEFARLEVGAITPKFSTVDMRLVVQRLAGTLQPRCAAKGLTLTVRVPEQPQLAKVDVVLIDRVLQNIADNAVKYTKSGGVSIEIRPNPLDGNTFDIQVEDTGVGISQEDHTEVGKPFFRGAAAVSQDIPGTGLGLANSHLLLSMMSGVLKLQTGFGGGCVAKVTLRKDWSWVPDAAPAITTPQHAVKYKRIALLEDDAGVRKALTLLLQMQHCDVVSAASGTALRAQFDLGFVPDFLIADYSLSDGETGVQALESAMKRFPHLPAAIVSGSVIDPALLPKGVAWLAKPVDHEQLLRLLSDRHA